MDTRQQLFIFTLGPTPVSQPLLQNTSPTNLYHHLNIHQLCHHHYDQWSPLISSVLWTLYNGHCRPPRDQMPGRGCHAITHSHRQHLYIACIYICICICSCLSISVGNCVFITYSQEALNIDLYIFIYRTQVSLGSGLWVPASLSNSQTFGWRRYQLNTTDDTNALCGYPHVKVSIRELSQISTTAPIFQLYNYFRQNSEENVTFTFYFFSFAWCKYFKFHFDNDECPW